MIYFQQYKRVSILHLINNLLNNNKNNVLMNSNSNRKIANNIKENIANK